MNPSLRLLFEVHPRYTVGVAGLADEQRATQVAEAERAAAEGRDLSGIVFRATLARTGVDWDIWDVITGWNGRIPTAKMGPNYTPLHERVTQAQRS